MPPSGVSASGAAATRRSWTDERTDGWMDGWMDGELDRQVDEIHACRRRGSACSTSVQPYVSKLQLYAGGEHLLEQAQLFGLQRRHAPPVSVVVSVGGGKAVGNRGLAAFRRPGAPWGFPRGSSCAGVSARPHGGRGGSGSWGDVLRERPWATPRGL